eukprot:1194282-Prorocentrum_minimum.AAC.2
MIDRDNWGGPGFTICVILSHSIVEADPPGVEGGERGLHESLLHLKHHRALRGLPPHLHLQKVRLHHRRRRKRHAVTAPPEIGHLAGVPRAQRRHRVCASGLRQPPSGVRAGVVHPAVGDLAKAGQAREGVELQEQSAKKTKV